MRTFEWMRGGGCRCIIGRRVELTSVELESMVTLSSRGSERLQPHRTPLSLALRIYDRHGECTAHQHNDPHMKNPALNPLSGVAALSMTLPIM